MVRKYAGWVKIDRHYFIRSRDNPLWKDKKLAWMFFELLSWASWEDGEKTKKYQTLTSYQELADGCEVTYWKARTMVKKLAENGFISIISNKNGLLLEYPDSSINRQENDNENTGNNQENDNNSAIENGVISNNLDTDPSRANQLTDNDLSMYDQQCGNIQSNKIQDEINNCSNINRREKEKDRIKNAEKEKEKESLYPTTTTTTTNNVYDPNGGGEREGEFIDNLILSEHTRRLLESCGINHHGPTNAAALALGINDSKVQLIAAQLYGKVKNGLKIKQGSEESYLISWLNKAYENEEKKEGPEEQKEYVEPEYTAEDIERAKRFHEFKGWSWP